MKQAKKLIWLKNRLKNKDNGDKMKNKKKILILVIIICLIGYIIMLFASQPSFVNKFYIRPIGEDDTMSLYLDMHNNAGFYSYEDESALGDSYKCNKCL